MMRVNAVKQRPRRCSWRKSTQCFSRRLFCCSCLCGEKDPLREQEKKINGAPLHAHSDQRGSGEKETIQITVEDLGIVNTNFSLFDEDSLTPRNSMSRSASSVCACPRALKKKRLKPLSSLPAQPQAEPAITCSNGEDDEQEDEELVLSESMLASENLLTPPVINLIPPTPSDFAETAKFFELNPEESVSHTSGSDRSFSAGDQDSYEDKIECVQTEQPKQGCVVAESTAKAESEVEPERCHRDELGEQREAVPIKSKENTKAVLLRSIFQVAPLPEYQEKRSFNAGINLLAFTEHNLDELSDRDLSCSNIVKRERCLLPHTATMATFAHQRRLITRSCSLEDTLTRSATFHALTQTTDQRHEEEGSPRQRRITVASYTPHCKDQNGNFPEKDTERQAAKPFKELNTEEVCQWFTRVGLRRCIPFIKEAKLCGADVASVDVNTLDILHIITLEDREQLLSAIYNELHPPSTITQRIDSLLESSGPTNVEAFTATLVSMTKSKSSPHVGSLSMHRRSLKLRNNSQSYVVQRSAQLIEITINASERIVHLRTPKETTVGKIMDSCIKMLGMTEDKNLFKLKEQQGSREELSPDQQIGTLLASSSSSSSPSSSLSANSQLELHLVKKDKPTDSASQDGPEENSSNENQNINNDIQGKQAAKEERIRELNQQVDSLQNVIRQVQDLHHDLVAFCSELKNMDGDANVDTLSSAEQRHRLEMVNSRLNDKRQNLQTLRDNITNFTANKKKQLEVHLLEKMKLNCQVFKEEICIVHLNRQAAHLHNALQESYIKEKAPKKTLAIGSLSQLVSPRSPVMLLVLQENQNPDGHYSFSCRYREGGGLVVVEVGNSQLCVDDRFLEVNGVSVVNSTHEELTDLLQQGPIAQIVVLRQPPAALPSPPSLQHTVSCDPVQTCCTGGDEVNAGTPPQRTVITI